MKKVYNQYSQEKRGRFMNLFGVKKEQMVFESIFQQRNIEAVKKSESEFVTDLDSVIKNNLQKLQSWDLEK